MLMRTTTLMPATLSAALVALAAGTAHADFISATLNVEGSVESMVNSSPNDAYDRRELNTSLSYNRPDPIDNGSGSTGPVSTAQRLDTGAQLNDLSSTITGSYSSTLSGDMARVELDLAGRNSRDTNRGERQSSLDFSSNLRVTSDADGLVEITLRAIFTGGNDANILLNGSLESRGIVGSSPQRITLGDQSPSEQTLVFTAEIREFRSVTLLTNAFLRIDAAGDPGSQILENLQLITEIRFIPVPAPSATGLLAGLGLLAARRRRN